MPRHKPASITKNTKAILQDMQEAREASQEIKAELPEHNSVIKIHADNNAPAELGGQEEKEDGTQSFSSASLKQENVRSMPHLAPSKTQAPTGNKPSEAVSGKKQNHYAAKAEELQDSGRNNSNSEDRQRRSENQSPAKPAQSEMGRQKGQSSGAPSFSLQKNMEQWMEINTAFTRMFFDHWAAVRQRPQSDKQD